MVAKIRGLSGSLGERLCIPKKWGGMGFRRLKEFNLAMLTKQALRFIHKPNSLVARVLKAKYYPDTCFLEAKRKGNLSFVWRNLMETQEIIRKHNRWRVGDGDTILIWRDRWPLDKDNPKIETPPLSLS